MYGEPKVNGRDCSEYRIRDVRCTAMVHRILLLYAPSRSRHHALVGPCLDRRTTARPRGSSTGRIHSKDAGSPHGPLQGNPDRIGNLGGTPRHIAWGRRNRLSRRPRVRRMFRDTTTNVAPLNHCRSPMNLPSPTLAVDAMKMKWPFADRTLAAAGRQPPSDRSTRLGGSATRVDTSLWRDWSIVVVCPQRTTGASSRQTFRAVRDAFSSLYKLHRRRSRRASERAAKPVAGARRPSAR